MDNYTKKLSLSFELPQKELDKIKEDVGKQVTDLHLAFKDLSSDDLKKIQDNLQKVQQEALKKSKLTSLQSALSSVEQTKDVKDLQKKIAKALADNTTLKDYMKDSWDKVFDTIKAGFKKVFKDVTNLVIGDNSILNQVSGYFNSQYGFGKKGWNTYQETGLYGADAYGYNKAMKRAGVNSLDELFIWMSTTQGAKEQFAEWVDLYRDQYDATKDMALELQKFKQEYQTMTEEFAMDFYRWFSSNKDMIKQMVQFAAEVFKGLASVIGNIISFFGNGQKEVGANDIVNSYRTSNTTNNHNIGITVNGTDGRQIGQEIYSYLQGAMAVR